MMHDVRSSLGKSAWLGFAVALASVGGHMLRAGISFVEKASAASASLRDFLLFSLAEARSSQRGEDASRKTDIEKKRRSLRLSSAFKRQLQRGSPSV